MKTIVLLALSLTSALMAQTTVFYTWNIQSSPVDAAVPISTTQDGAVAGANFLFAIPAPGATPSTLTASATAAVTTLSLASITGLQVGNGVCFSPSPSTCSIAASMVGSTFTLTTGEVALITAITPGVLPAGTVTVTRHSIGTAAAYASGRAVSFLRSGSYSQMAANVQRDFNVAIITQPQYGSASATAAASAIAAAQATLAANAQVH